MNINLRLLAILLLVMSVQACKKKSIPIVSVPDTTPKEIQKGLSEEDSLDLKIGQMVMIGIGEKTGLSSQDSLINEIRTNKVGGIVLYEKNIAKADSKRKLKELNLIMQQSSKLPLFITIDEEGGKVHRMKEKYGFVNIPSAAYLGKLNNIDSTYFYTKKLVAVMAEVGINLNYAPDVDLAINPQNPVIAKLERSFSNDPDITTAHALACIKAHKEFKVKTILKHFPGHGSSADDTHLGVADVTTRWNFKELLPYHNILQSGQCEAIMTAHIINCHLDSTCVPGTLSKAIVTGILRNFMEYKGVVFSDDMQMYAISKNFGFETGIKMAINAGVDVLMFANNVNMKDRVNATQVHAIIKKLVKEGQVPREKINESYKRIIEFKKDMLVLK